MNYAMEKYKYMVTPRIPIRNLIPGKLINRESILNLNIDQVKVCLQHGIVRRRFDNDPNNMIQVTLSNIEQLHRPTYTETVEETPTVKEEVKPVKVYETPIIEEVDKTLVEEVVDNTVETVTDTQVEEIKDEVAEDNKEDVVEESVEEVKNEKTEEATKNNQPQQQYHNNNKKYQYTKRK